MIRPLRARGVLSMVAREEVWALGELREERIAHGRAEHRDDIIIAADDADDDLLAIAEGLMRRARRVAAADAATARIVVSARRPGGGPVMTEAAIVFSLAGRAVVSTPDDAAADLALLMRLGPADDARTADYRGLPLVWRNGSGAVLMHEAAGHPAEHGREPVPWPSWLSVCDEPLDAVDDLGRPTRRADLLRGERPSSARTASFADVPLARMSRVVVRQENAPFAVPARRIDVHLVGAGGYDPLSDSVQLLVSGADLVDGGSVRALAPFVIEESRSSIAFALRGASGEAVRYPGVICSSEGQELVVGSYAPLLLTEF